MVVRNGRWVQEYPLPPRDLDCSADILYELVATRALGFGIERPLGNLAHGVALPVDGAWEIETGTMAVAVRPGGAAASDPPAVVGPRVVLEEGDLLRWAAYDDGGLAIWQVVDLPPDVGSLAAGESVIRFIHLAPAEGRLSLYGPGPPLACVAWAGDVGLCAWP